MALHGPFLKLRFIKCDFLLRAESIRGVVGRLNDLDHCEIHVEGDVDAWKASDSFDAIRRALAAALSTAAALRDSPTRLIVDVADYEPLESKP